MKGKNFRVIRNANFQVLGVNFAKKYEKMLNLRDKTIKSSDAF